MEIDLSQIRMGPRDGEREESVGKVDEKQNEDILYTHQLHTESCTADCILDFQNEYSHKPIRLNPALKTNLFSL